MVKFDWRKPLNQKIAVFVLLAVVIFVILSISHGNRASNEEQIGHIVTSVLAGIGAFWEPIRKSGITGGFLELPKEGTRIMANLVVTVTGNFKSGAPITWTKETPVSGIAALALEAELGGGKTANAVLNSTITPTAEGVNIVESVTLTDNIPLLPANEVIPLTNLSLPAGFEAEIAKSLSADIDGLSVNVTLKIS